MIPILMISTPPSLERQNRMTNHPHQHPNSCILEHEQALLLMQQNVLLFKYALRHGLTAKAIDELLYLMSVLLPKDAEIPQSVRQLKNYFVLIHSEQKPEMQDYCSNCLRLLEGGEKCDCEDKQCQFVTVPLGPQIKARLESKQNTYST